MISLIRGVQTVNLCNRLLWAAAAGARVIISLGCRNVWPEPHDDCDDEETSSSHMTAQLGRFNLKQCAIAQQHFCCSVWQTGDSYSQHCLQFSVSRQEQRNHQGLCPWVELLAFSSAHKIRGRHFPPLHFQLLGYKS